MVLISLLIARILSCSWPKFKFVLFLLQESVLSRTSHVLSSLALAESEPAKLARIEDLISHLKQYPEAKHGAVKVSMNSAYTEQK